MTDKCDCCNDQFREDDGSYTTMVEEVHALEWYEGGNEPPTEIEIGLGRPTWVNAPVGDVGSHPIKMSIAAVPDEFGMAEVYTDIVLTLKQAEKLSEALSVVIQQIQSQEGLVVTEPVSEEPAELSRAERDHITARVWAMYRKQDAELLQQKPGMSLVNTMWRMGLHSEARNLEVHIHQALKKARERCKDVPQITPQHLKAILEGDLSLNDLGLPAEAMNRD